MNQVVHIFRKDCRHLWSNIAAVLVLTFLHGYGVVIDRGGTASGFTPYALMMMLAGLSTLLLPVALFLLVVSVIQEESLVGSDHFWLTRPYSRRHLFLEKLLFTLVWAVLPMLLHDVVLVRYFGFSLSSAFGLLFWKTAQLAFFLVVAAALAVLSASFGRAVVLGFAAVLLTLFTLYAALQNSGGALAVATSAIYVFRTLLVLAAVGALAVVAFQYRFRIASVAGAIGVAVILACALLLGLWPQSLSNYLARQRTSLLLQSVQVHPDANLTGLPRPRPAQARRNRRRGRRCGLASRIRPCNADLRWRSSAAGPEEERAGWPHPTGNLQGTACPRAYRRRLSRARSRRSRTG